MNGCLVDDDGGRGVKVGVEAFSDIAEARTALMYAEDPWCTLRTRLMVNNPTKDVSPSRLSLSSGVK